ncbi:MAG: hypothetical protein RSD68_02195, partial [Oscillospiraceae bacterium]
MASTNKTANLGLNQWVESDPFLREDANADNSRIDAETKRLQAQLDAAPYVKLFDVTTTADARQVDLDVSGIDFSKYAMVQLFSNAVSRKIDSSNNSSQNIRMQINGGGGRRTLSGNSGNEIEENYVALYERLDSGPVSIRAD